MAEYNATMETKVYKRVGGLDLTLDIYTPTGPQSAEPLTAVVFYHGGFMVVGTKTSWPPVWLLRASMKRNWIYVSPSYRLLPEATGEEMIGDALDAARWVVDNITSRVIITGGSGGGYIAVTTAAQLRSPRPLALLSVYGMNDLSRPEYIEGMKLPFAAPLSDAEIDSVAKEITATRGLNLIDGYTPSEDPTDKRMTRIAVMLQRAMYPEVITGVPYLSLKIKESGTGAIQPEHRKFWPLIFGLTKDFPPTGLIHGTADDLVYVSQSTAAEEKLKAAGVDVILETVPGGGHGFDGEVLNVDDSEVEQSELALALRKIVDFLAQAAAKSHS